MESYEPPYYNYPRYYQPRGRGRGSYRGYRRFPPYAPPPGPNAGGNSRNAAGAINSNNNNNSAGKQKPKTKQKKVDETGLSRVYKDLRGGRGNNHVALYIRGDDPRLSFRTYLFVKNSTISRTHLVSHLKTYLSCMYQIYAAITELPEQSISLPLLGGIAPVVSIRYDQKDGRHMLKLGSIFIKDDEPEDDDVEIVDDFKRIDITNVTTSTDTDPMREENKDKDG